MERLAAFIPKLISRAWFSWRSGVATNVVMTIVMAVTMDAHADTDATNMNADYGSIDRAYTQQGQGTVLFRGMRVSPLSPTPAWMTVAVVRSLEITARSKSYKQTQLFDCGFRI
jgi:hypothetical protein